MTNQSWDPVQYQSNAAFVSYYGASVVELLGDVSGQNILDLGCGDGTLTASIQDLGAEVYGVDSSEEMVASAIARGLKASTVDARCLQFEKEFDAAFTNAVLHWIPEIQPVLSGVARALKPGGRFVGEMGGFGNVAAIQTALLAGLDKAGIDFSDRFPHYFPTTEEFSLRLEEAGFVVDQIGLIHRPTVIPNGMRSWLETLARAHVSGLSPDIANQVYESAVSYLKPSLCDSQGIWTADYVRLRFVAHLK